MHMNLKRALIGPIPEHCLTAIDPRIDRLIHDLRMIALR